MRWERLRRSANVEDRRGMAVRRGVQLGGGGLIVALLVALLGGPGALQQYLGGTEPSASPPVDPAQDVLADFSARILGDTEDVWGTLFQLSGRTYAPPRLVLFSDAVGDSACGYATSAVGPFYCPGNRKVYIDLTFFEELDPRFGAPGDFAQAYVISREVGHHVQTLTGVSARTRRAQQGASRAEANQLSVRQELQADCYAGVWAHHTQRARDVLEPGELEEALRAASAIGDDTLRRRARGRISPETFTHGSAAQRKHWFEVGFRRGDPQACDTFANAAP